MEATIHSMQEVAIEIVTTSKVAPHPHTSINIISLQNIRHRQHHRRSITTEILLEETSKSMHKKISVTGRILPHLLQKQSCSTKIIIVKMTRPPSNKVQERGVSMLCSETKKIIVTILLQIALDVSKGEIQIMKRSMKGRIEKQKSREHLVEKKKKKVLILVKEMKGCLQRRRKIEMEASRVVAQIWIVIMSKRLQKGNLSKKTTVEISSQSINQGDMKILKLNLLQGITTDEILTERKFLAANTKMVKIRVETQNLKMRKKKG